MTGTSRACRGYAIALVVVALLAAFAFPLSAQLSGMQDADGIITAYMSTQKLTWYFWRQDRFLNLLPALAWPVANVAWNLHLQIFLRAFFAFLAPLGVLYVLRPSARFLLPATLVASALLAVLLDGIADFNLYVHHVPVGTSLVLFAVSAMLFRRRERGWPWLACAFAIAFLAYATNIALLLLALPLLALAFALNLSPRRELAAFLALNVLVIVLAYGHARVFGEAQTQFGSGEVSWHAIRHGYAVVASRLHVAGFCVAALLAVMAGLFCRRRDALAAALFALYCLAGIGGLSCSQWVQVNLYEIRYYLMFEVGLAACIAFVLVGATERVLATEWRMGALVVLSLGVAWSIGLHGTAASPDELVGSTWRESARDWGRAAIEHRAQVVAGDFWDAWPTVFEADRLRGADAASREPIHAATWRSRPLHARVVESAAATGSLRVLCLPELADCVHAVEDAFQVRVVAPPEAAEELRDAKGRGMRLLTLRIAPPAAAGMPGSQ